MGHDTRRRRVDRVQRSSTKQKKLGVRSPDTLSSFGQLCWRDLSENAKKTRLRVEMRAAIVATDAVDDTPGDDECFDVAIGWSMHRMEQSPLVDATMSRVLTKKMRQVEEDLLVGWLAREIYVENDLLRVERIECRQPGVAGALRLIKQNDDTIFDDDDSYGRSRI